MLMSITELATVMKIQEGFKIIDNIIVLNYGINSPTK
jgi:hypothetical protein